MPGANARALEKAKTLPADTLVLDLEDSVAPDLKRQARDAVAAAVATGEYGCREVLVRSNALDSEWGGDDLDAAVGAGADGVLVPKVTDRADILALEERLSAIGAPAGFGLWVMIEMPLAVLNLGEIAGAARGTRLTGLVLGLNDLAKEMNAVPTPDRLAFHAALNLAVTAARAHGLVAIDAVFNDIRDEAGLAAECEQGRVMGFDGKSLIHPAQLATANRVFSPDPADVAHARAVVEAFALPENQGRGVIKVDGRMTELLHLAQAQRLLAISEAIAPDQPEPRGSAR